jgi:hypothetical protein
MMTSIPRNIPFLDYVCRAIDTEDVKRQVRLLHGELDRWILKLRDTWCRVVRQTLPTASVDQATDASVWRDSGITASSSSPLYK